MRLTQLSQIFFTSRAMSSSAKTPLAPMAPKGAIEDVWNYPRPPLLQRTPNHLQVIFYPSASPSSPIVIADTTAGYRVCETSHPPTYYLPTDSIQPGVELKRLPKESYCEWKGKATYWSVKILGDNGEEIKERVWSYERPTEGFEEIKGYLSFYASSGRNGKGGQWKCYVDGEEVGVQEG